MKPTRRERTVALLRAVGEISESYVAEAAPEEVSPDALRNAERKGNSLHISRRFITTVLPIAAAAVIVLFLGRLAIERPIGPANSANSTVSSEAAEAAYAEEEAGMPAEIEGDAAEEPAVAMESIEAEETMDSIAIEEAVEEASPALAEAPMEAEVPAEAVMTAGTPAAGMLAATPQALLVPDADAVFSLLFSAEEKSAAASVTYAAEESAPLAEAKDEPAAENRAGEASPANMQAASAKESAKEDGGTTLSLTFESAQDAETALYQSGDETVLAVTRTVLQTGQEAAASADAAVEAAEAESVAEVLTLSGIPVTVTREESEIASARWSDGSFLYSLEAPVHPLTEAELEALVTQIH